MGKVIPNPAAVLFKGTIGDLVFVQRNDDQVIVRRRPTRVKPWTAAQIVRQHRFQAAVGFSKSLNLRPELKTFYELMARLKRKRACDLAISDFLTAPRFGEIELSQYTGKPTQIIAVEAIDIVPVKSVQIRIDDLAGQLIEEGAAARVEGSETAWAYRAQADLAPGQTVVILLTVADYPGNTVSKRVDHALLTIGS